jgi:hypothetical protein
MCENQVGYVHDDTQAFDCISAAVGGGSATKPFDLQAHSIQEVIVSLVVNVLVACSLDWRNFGRYETDRWSFVLKRLIQAPMHIASRIL